MWKLKKKKKKELKFERKLEDSIYMVTSCFFFSLWDTGGTQLKRLDESGTGSWPENRGRNRGSANDRVEIRASDYTGAGLGEGTEYGAETSLSQRCDIKEWKPD